MSIEVPGCVHDMNREMGWKIDREVDVSNLTGEWINVSNQVDYIESLSLYLEGNELKLKILSANSEYDISSECHKITAYSESGSRQASGFYLHDKTGCDLSVNEKNGVLVIQSYFNTTKNNRVLNILTREFYCKKKSDNKIFCLDDMVDSIGGGVAEAIPIASNFMEASDDMSLVAINGYEDILGLWRNTNSSSKWVDSVLIQRKGPVFCFELYSKNKKYIWPEINFIPCSLDGDECGFSCFSYFNNLKSFFSIYSNKGLLVMTAFYSICRDNKAINTMSREFYTKKIL